MSIFSFLTSRKHKRDLSVSSSILSPFVINRDGSTLTPAVVNPSEALTNSDVFAIISRISSNIAGMKLKTGDPRLNQVLAQPSNLINGFSFWQR